MKKANTGMHFFGKTRAARVNLRFAALTLLALAVCIGCNALIGLLPYSLSNPDVTGSQTFRLSAKTHDWLNEMQEDITLYLLCEGGKANADGDIYSFLLQYEDACSHIKAEVVDTASVSADRLREMGLEEAPESMSLLVKSKKRARLIENSKLYYYYNSELGVSLTPEQYTAYINAYVSGTDSSSEAYYYGYVLYNYAGSTTAYFDGESRITNALNFVTLETVPVAYFLVGNETVSLDSALESRILQTGYQIRTLSSLEALDGACQLLIIHTPTADLSDAEAEALSAYLANGGKLFLTTFYAIEDANGKLTIPLNLNRVLSEYGLSFENSLNIVTETDSSYLFNDSSQYVFYTHTSSRHPITQGMNGELFVTYYAHAISLKETADVTQTALLYSSEDAKLIVLDQENEKWNETEEGSRYTVGAVAEKGSTQIVWVSSADALTFSTNALSQSANFDFVLSSLNYLSGTSDNSISIDSAAIASTALNVTTSSFLLWGTVLVLILPAAVAITGFAVCAIRKKR